ncbi:O-antigen ligase family protein [Deinococcus sp. RM]|uniref:O-antigen ligase family protein n=1 Tax=Deinococcus sp. RM TaxID=2316359 RepID=UPI0011C2120A|nr:O-antigen ligase family protein [Deinococcus sp. RM]
MATGLERLALLVACLALAWGPLAQGSTFGVWFSGLIILGSVTLALTFLATGVRGRLTLPNPWWPLFAALFLAWVWRSALTAPDVLAGERWAGIWTAVLGVAFSLAALAGTYRRQQVVLSTLLVTGGAAVTLALLQQRGIFVPGFTYLDGVPEQILTGPYFHPSHFSGYLIMVAALCTTVLLNTRPGWHTLPILALAAGTQYVNLFTDGSSIPAVILAAGVPMLVWLWKKAPWLGAALTVGAGAAAVWVVLSLTTPQGQQTFDAYKTRLGIDSQNLTGFLQGREDIHQFGEAMWHEHQNGGVGIGQWGTEFQRYRPTPSQGISATYVNYAHSDYLMVLSELGRTGAALLAMVIVLALFRRGKTVLSFTGLAILPVYLFTGLYDSHLSAIPGTMLVAFSLFLGTRAFEAINYNPPYLIAEQSPQRDPVTGMAS